MSEHQIQARDAAGVLAWRARRLAAAGFSKPEAWEIATTPGVDLHLLLELIDRGCPPALAARITAPIDPVRQTRGQSLTV
jgi:xanthine/CO dehydrogenase XdhC/CoxF family maturation factor